MILLLVVTTELLDAAELVEIIEAADVELEDATEEELELDELEAVDEGIIIFEVKVGRELDEEEELEDGAVELELLKRVVGVIEVRTLDELETEVNVEIEELELEVKVEPGGVSTTTSAQLQNLSDFVSIDH